MTMTERRDGKRIPARFKVNFVHDGDYLISFSKDISVAGMFLYTENPAPLGESTELTFTIGDLKDETVTATVMWVNNTNSPKDSGMGVQFINPSLHLKNAILQIVNRVALVEDSSRK